MSCRRGIESYRRKQWVITKTLRGMVETLRVIVETLRVIVVTAEGYRRNTETCLRIAGS